MGRGSTAKMCDTMRGARDGAERRTDGVRRGTAMCGRVRTWMGWWDDGNAWWCGGGGDACEV